MSMSDRELLEFAAKAAGINHPGGEHCLNGPAVWDCDRMVWWRPLTDDGDALRLAVALSLLIRHRANRMEAYLMGYPSSKASERFNYDPDRSAYDQPQKQAATRRAITRAAAEIGKAMQEQPK